MQCVLGVSLAIVILTARAGHPTDGPDPGTVQSGNALYRAAVEDARAGRLEQALAALQTLVGRFPERQDILGDYAVVLGWAGQDTAALALLPRLHRAGAPTPVIEGLATSARHLQRYDLAESLYREALARAPERVEPQIGLARTLADAGQLDAATALVGRLRATHPHRADVLEAVADLALARQDYFGALAAYRAILAREPAHRGALRGRIQTLGRLGAPHLGLELADRTRGVLLPREREALAADRTAHEIRWGAIAAGAGRGPLRFAGIDRALADSEAAGARALDRTAELTATERQLALDRVGALHDRYRMRDSVALYEAMAARPTPMPSWATSAAASAYLYLQHPKRSSALYREALALDASNIDLRIGLFFALAESEEHAPALEEIERAVAITPQWIDAWSPATTRENPAYAQVLSARAMAPLLANRPGEAAERLRELSGRAPYNTDIRTDHASVMRARGWPRAAEAELRWVLAVDPDNDGALGERAGALLEARDYREAEAALALAQEVGAENGRVIRAARLLHVHNMRELIIDGTYGHSSGGPTGTQDYGVDTWLYSSPLHYNYRLFAHAYNAGADFDGGAGRLNRVGTGLEYRSRLITATAELSFDLNEEQVGGAVSLAVTPDDHWTIRGTVDTLSTDTPLQARLVGINARRESGEVIWRAHESRSAALGYAHMAFSDGNDRHSLQAQWTERVIAGPVYKLELTGALYASTNSRSDRPYFNPSRDFSPTLELANQWLQWRRYTRAFRHRLVVFGGAYWQKGFGTGPVYGARYEQEWEADDRLTLRYGIGVTRHPYDGVGETRPYAYLSLNWRF